MSPLSLPFSVRIEVGLASQHLNENNIFVTLRTALSKTKNVILMRKGYQEALFYCNAETQTLLRRGDQTDWFYINKNCEPTDIVIVSMRRRFSFLVSL